MNKTKVIKQLRQLSKGKSTPFRKREVGICSILDATWIDVVTVMDYSRQWPKYSGSARYPVPHPTKSPEKAYHRTSNLWSLFWNWNRADREYVRNRRELCAYLAYRLEND